MNNLNDEILMFKYVVLYSYCGICFGLCNGFISSVIFCSRYEAFLMLIGIFIGAFLGIIIGNVRGKEVLKNLK